MAGVEDLGELGCRKTIQMTGRSRRALLSLVFNETTELLVIGQAQEIFHVDSVDVTHRRYCSEITILLLVWIKYS